MDLEGLSIICAGLGSIEEDESGDRIGYTKSEHCLENLKDLLRFMRRDDPTTREVFKLVCKWNTVGKHLIPIMEYCQDDHNLVLNAVKVLVFLTMPLEVGSNDVPQQIEYLWGLKSSITSSDTVAVIVSLLEKPLGNLECGAFTEDDWKLVQLVLTLFRNILAVQDITLHQKAGGTATQFLSLRDKFLEILFQENVMDIILVLAQNVGGTYGYMRPDNLLILETFHYIFMGQDPELIAKVHEKESKEDAYADAAVNSLKSIIEEEKEKQKIARQRYLGRHSQFNGAFTWVTMDGSKTLCKGKPSSDPHDNLFNAHSKQRGPVKRTAWDQGRLPSTKKNILKLLYDFIGQFLSGGYNVLMDSVRDDIEKEHNGIENCDVAVFFQVAQFIMSYQYHKLSASKPQQTNVRSEIFADNGTDGTLFSGDLCGPVAASMKEAMFVLVISKWRNAFDGLKETNDYKFLSAAGSLMKAMILMLDTVLKLSSEDSKESRTACVLLYKLFYDQTEQGMTQFLLNLIKLFDIHKQARSDLADLVEMIHVIVRLMENLQASGTLRVSRKSRKGRRKKPLTGKDSTYKLDGDGASTQNDTGLSVSEPLVNLGMGAKEDIANTGGEVVEKDASILVQVNDLEPNVSEMKNDKGELPPTDDKNPHKASEDLEESDSSGDDHPNETAEVDYKASTLVSALANNSLIENLCWLLSFYKSNSSRTNHYIICTLRRICEDLELSPMLYQLSLLTTFYKILDEQKSHPCKEHENIVSFLTTLLRRMLRKMKSQPLLFAEILFWKTRRECNYISCESMLQELRTLKKETGNWVNLWADEGQGGTRRNIADALGDDEADFVNLHDSVTQRDNDTIAEESVKSDSHEVNGDKEAYGREGHQMDRETARVSTKKKNVLLNDDVEGKLRSLYEKYKGNPQCLRLIAEAIDPDGKVSSAQVSKKLKRLGFNVSRKRILPLEGASASHSDQQDSTNFEESSMSRKPLHSRKRVRAFSQDQETKIRELFEQFKDQRRCSFMIANALDAPETFSSLQISRKLKQLGLHVSRQKPSVSKMELRDESSSGDSVDGDQDSDDEPLSSLVNRNYFKSSGASDKRSLKHKAGEELSEDGSDDLSLRCIMDKSTKRPKKDEHCTTNSTDKSVLGRVPGDESTQDMVQSGDDNLREQLKVSLRPILLSREGHITSGDDQVTEYDAMDAVPDHTRMDTESGDAEAINNSSGKEVGAELDIKLDHIPRPGQDDELANEFEDSDSDDTAPVAQVEDAITRRKLRIVVESDDDEEL